MGVAFISGMQGDHPALLEDRRDRQALRRPQRPGGRPARVRRARQRARSRRHLPAPLRGDGARRARRLGDGGLQPGQRRGVRRQPDAAQRTRCAAGGASSATSSATAAPSTTSGSITSWCRRPPRRRRPRCAPAPTSTAGGPTGISTRRSRAASITEKELDRALVRLFTARFRLGLFDPPDAGALVGARARADRGSPAHLALAREAAARSIVLLENRNNTLPLAPSVRRLAVVGPMADDLPVLLANYHGIPSHPVRLLDGVRAAARARGVTVGYAAGSRLVETSPAAIAEAVAVASDSDVVVAFVGLDPRLEGEAARHALQPGRRPARPGHARRAAPAGGGAVCDRQARDRRADRRQRAGGAVAGVARGGRRSTPGTRAPRAGTRSRTCCSATSTRPAACRSRSTGRPPTCRRSPTTRCAAAPTATSRASRCTASATACRTRRSATRRSARPRAPTPPPRSRSRTSVRARVTRWSRSTSSRAARRPTRRAAGWPASSASRSSRASAASSRSRSAPTR